MGKKRNNNGNNKKFVAPIPVTLSSDAYGPLPQVYPHNPISWVYFAIKYLIVYTKPVPQSLIPNIQVKYEEGVYKVTQVLDMTRLWDWGFFGKGNLSRSDPSWESRTERRLHLNQQEGRFELSNEEITKLRRQERMKFKNERSKEHELEMKKKNGRITDDELQQLAAIKQLLIDFRKSNKIRIREEFQTPIAHNEMRPEDQDIVDQHDMRLMARGMEYLQLEPVEVFFLKFGLGLVDVMDIRSNLELFFQCCRTQTPRANNEFIIKYMVYHHYRSLGWCARSGIKFGCDYILYKRGPPYSHAEHAILIMTTDGTIEKSLIELQTISRVIGSVKKNLILTYVNVPNDNEFNEILFNDANDHDKFVSICQLYNITEIVYRRWVPNRTRE